MLRTQCSVLRGACLASLAGRFVAASLAAGLVFAACYNYNLTDPNHQVLSSLTDHPTRANISAAATGVFDAERVDAESFVWRTGSMGREGINLSGNNQPDYQEPYFGPLSASEFGAALWFNQFVAVRDANILIDATPKAPDLSAAEKALVIAFGQTVKSLMFLEIIETRDTLGMPVDVDRPPTATPTPFVTADSAYATILHTLDSARTNLTAGASASFPFPIPPGYSNFNSPATFTALTWALTAKALVLRATVQPHASGTPGAASFYALALTALGSSFLSVAPTDFNIGAYYDFSTGLGDVTNGLSDPLNGPLYFALPQEVSDAQPQAPPNAALPDNRVVTKISPIPPGQPPQVLSGVPIQGNLKFTNYFIGGNANPGAPIPIIRDEELILLRAEAKLGTGDLAGATSDLNITRVASGNLLPLAPGLTTAQLVTQLMYERRYSLMWENGTRWLDARRFGLLGTLPPAVPAGQVPSVMLIPTTECDARSLTTPCSPLHH